MKTVENGGSDSNDGLSWETPIASTNFFRYRDSQDEAICYIDEGIYNQAFCGINNVTFIGKKEKTRFKTIGTSNGTYFVWRCCNCNFVDMTFDYSPYGSWGWFIMSDNDCTSYKNCAFYYDLTHYSELDRLILYNENTNVSNCSFFINSNYDISFLGFSNKPVTFNNCTINKIGDYGDYNESLLVDTSINNEDFSSSKYDSVAGVYSGDEYSWNHLCFKYYLKPRSVYKTNVPKIYFNVFSNTYSGKYDILFKKNSEVIKDININSRQYQEIFSPENIPEIVNILYPDKNKEVALKFKYESLYRIKVERSFIPNELGYNNKNLFQNNKINKVV